MRESTVLQRPSQEVEPENSVSSPNRAVSGEPGHFGGMPAEVGVDSLPGLGSLLARLANMLLSRRLGDAAFFEVRNIFTGETAQSLGLFADGTMADRAARDLGRDWRVFRREDPTTTDLIALGTAVQRS